ncbi:MAG TPA: hypothetical protein VK541_14710 [Pedobacter sp.]|uniref:hypothetical protein n=1 Tax=Pedobacter sp. TaxID=1411316 RepID=UPI002BD0FCD7|nr:hypothetical protein [Pedobacter sp.]HMI03732.1 hypothetical protein [Pedobacter sp.]
MRTVKQLPAGIPKEEDETKFPDSTVINETDDAAGTPVVREIYGDILTNVYKILRLTKVTASGTEDNELNGYQLVEALKKFSNSMNDIEQQLNLTGSVFSINLDLSILPNRYVCFAKSVEASGAGPYTFKGSGATEYTFQAVNPFLSGDLVLLIIDSATVRAYKMGSTGGTATIPEKFTPFGTPLSFSDFDDIYYQSEGVLFTDQPVSYDIQGAVRVAESDGTLLVYEMMIASDFLYCLVFAPGTLIYKIFRFSMSDLATPSEVTITGTQFPSGVIAADHKPNIYTDGSNLIITNDSGNSANDYEVNIYLIDHTAGEITETGSVSLNAAFPKSTNAVIYNNFIYTFIAGSLSKYNLGTGVQTLIGSFPALIGVLFRIKTDAYYSNGEVAKKWTLN